MALGIVDEFFDSIFGELDNEVAAAMIAGPKKLAVDMEAREAHKAPLRDAILAKKLFCQSPEEVCFRRFLTLGHALGTASRARTRSIQAMVLVCAGSILRRSATKRTGVPSG